MTQAVPKIQRNPRTVSQNALHYGYVAYQDILLGGKQVQPDNSPYFQVIPCRELIPFTNLDVGEIDEKQIQNPKRPKGQAPVKIVQKTAFQCAQEMEISYADWAFTILHPLTGLSEDDAFRIFQTIQPFKYKFKDIQLEVGQAESRIEQTEAYTVTYEGETKVLDPLSDDEKEIALKVWNLLTPSINHAVDVATDKWQKTITSMTRAFAGGEGKVSPDPLDRKLAIEFGTQTPQLVDVKADEAKKQTEADDLRREEIALRKQEIALKERELELREKEASNTANKERMAQVRAAKQPTA
jgi:hypothetical protein